MLFYKLGIRQCSDSAKANKSKPSMGNGVGQAELAFSESSGIRTGTGDNEFTVIETFTLQKRFCSIVTSAKIQKRSLAGPAFTRTAYRVDIGVIGGEYSEDAGTSGVDS